MSKKHHINRRNFLYQASCASVGLTTLFSTVLNLKAVDAAAKLNLGPAMGPFDDYKAMVCLLLGGGADSYNMLIPTDNSDYQEYADARSNLAIPQGDIIPINYSNNGKTFGIHPSMTNLASAFNDGDAAFIANVGSLIEPTDLAGIQNGTVQLPLGLYSHADQVMHWQTAIPHDRVATGWGGKIADMLNALDMPPNSNPDVPMSMSLSGSNVYQRGVSSSEFSVSPWWGVLEMNGYGDEWLSSQLRTTCVDNIIDAQYQDIFQATYINTVKSARDGSLQLKDALDNATPFQTEFDQENYLSQAFQRIAEVISARDTLGMKRQIFFVEYGGWDHHDELLDSQAALLSDVDNALHSFKLAMEEINMQNQVTTFSISDFARTLISNGNGTDHAWGGNAFIMGGAVNGGTVYGSYPQLALNGNLQVGNGVLIPTTSADEYFAELALWFNVPSSGLLDIFPNLGNFYSPTSGGNPIGFMNL